MITTLAVQGARPASVLSLGGFMPSDDPVIIRDIDGLGPVKADISTVPSGTSRGETYQGSSTTKRNIVLTLGLNPNWSTQTVSSLRQLLYGYFMTEEWCKLRFFSDELPTTDIEGYVESFEPNIFSQDPEVQVSVVCPRPDFIDIDASIFKGVIGASDLQFEFNYDGTVSSGLELRVDRTVDRPSYTGPLFITVENAKGVKTIAMESLTVDTEKSFKLSSVQGHKRVQYESLINGDTTNLLKLKSGDWPMLEPGLNLLTVAAMQPGQEWTLAYFNRFGGL